jgi:hypothetical protein
VPEIDLLILLNPLGLGLRVALEPVLLMQERQVGQTSPLQQLHPIRQFLVCIERPQVRPSRSRTTADMTLFVSWTRFNILFVGISKHLRLCAHIRGVSPEDSTLHKRCAHIQFCLVGFVFHVM